MKRVFNYTPRLCQIIKNRDELIERRKSIELKLLVYEVHGRR